MSITALFGRHKNRRRLAGNLVKRNAKTVLMRLLEGKKKTIKRHIGKDQVS